MNLSRLGGTRGGAVRAAERLISQAPGRSLWWTAAALLAAATGAAATEVTGLFGVDTGVGRSVVLMAVTLGSAALVTARAVLVRIDRGGWALFAAALWVNAIAGLLWQFWLRSPEIVPIAGTKLLWLLVHPLCAAALVVLAPRDMIGRSRTHAWLDGVIVGATTAAVGALLIGRLGEPMPVGTLVAAAPLLSACGSVLVLGVALGVLAGRHWRGDLALWLVAAACLIWAAAGLAELASRGSEVPAIIATGWPVAAALIALAAWARQRQRTGPKGIALHLVFASSVVAFGVVLHATLWSSTPLAISLATLAIVAGGMRTVSAFRELRSLAEARQWALCDDLTGLANRRRLFAELDAVLGSRDHREGLVDALFLVDLDRFKDVNDALGHAAGDALLCQVGQRLAETLPQRALLARLSGDEFAALVPGLRRKAVSELATTLRAALSEPVDVDGTTLRPEASIGIAIHPDHADNRDHLLRCADAAMYAAKCRGAGTAEYQESIDQIDRDLLDLVEDLRQALDSEQIICYYQPKAHLRSGKVVGVEALARWHHPQKGMVQPGVFIPLAERFGLMPRLTERVLRVAVAQAAQWTAEGLAPSVAVNLSASNLLDTHLVATVRRLLSDHDLPGSALNLEITEQVLMSDPDRARTVVDALRGLGVQVAIDDFGTGYSSLASLQALPVTELKLDRRFVTGVASNPRDAAIVRSTVELARAFDLVMVAEGVESAEDWSELERLGCDVAQGFHLGRPMDPVVAGQWLADRLALRRPA